ncbi:MAG: hypothetical protein PGN13_01300 [Patulibacter minatonensis]
MRRLEVTLSEHVEFRAARRDRWFDRFGEPPLEPRLIVLVESHEFAFHRPFNDTVNRNLYSGAEVANAVAENPDCFGLRWTKWRVDRHGSARDAWLGRGVVVERERWR